MVGLVWNDEGVEAGRRPLLEDKNFEGMVCSTCFQAPLKKRKDRGQGDIQCSNVDYASKFMNHVTEGVLFEIFLRLPDWRSAIQMSFVCRRWHSLISHPNFIRNFIHHHHYCQQQTLDYSYTRPSTLLFSYTQSSAFMFHYHKEKPFGVLSSEKSEVLHERSPFDYLSFIDESTFLKASCDDLLLVASYDCDSDFSEDYFICNPLTGQDLALPRAPRIQHEMLASCALICKPTSCDEQLGCTTNTQCQYKTGKWSKSNISCPPRQEFDPLVLGMVECNGIILQLCSSEVILAFEPFNDTDSRRCYFIDLPAGFSSWSCTRDGQEARLGVVCGRVRLSRISNINEDLELKIWELNYNDDGSNSWVLKHNEKLRISVEKFIIEKVCMLGFDPNNGHMVYVACDNNICQYNIEVHKLEKVGEFPFDKHELELFNYDTGMNTVVMPIMHPIWPTQIPPLPPS